MKLCHKNKVHNVKFARILPSIGSPATLPIEEAVSEFSKDYGLYQRLQWKGLGVKAPKLEITIRDETIVFNGDDVIECECGFLKSRRQELDYPIEGMDGYFEGFKCLSCGDEYYEPMD